MQRGETEIVRETVTTEQAGTRTDNREDRKIDRVWGSDDRQRGIHWEKETVDRLRNKQGVGLCKHLEAIGRPSCKQETQLADGWTQPDTSPNRGCIQAHQPRETRRHRK